MIKTTKDIAKEIKEVAKAEGINRSDISISTTKKLITIKTPDAGTNETLKEIINTYTKLNYFSVSYEIGDEYKNIETLIQLAKSEKDTSHIMRIMLQEMYYTDETIKNLFNNYVERTGFNGEPIKCIAFLDTPFDNENLKRTFLEMLERTEELTFDETEEEATENENKTEQTAGEINEPAKDINLTVNIVDENEKINGITLQRTYNIINLKTGKIVAEYYNRNEAEQKLQHLHKQSPKQYAGYEGGYLYPNDGSKIKMTVSPTLKIKTAKTLEKIKSNLRWEMMNGDDYGVAEYIYDKIEEELNKKHIFV